MKPSPVQLLQSTIEKISVDANLDFDPQQDEQLGDNVELQVRELCEPFPQYWETQGQTPPIEGLEDRTFVVRLAIRTDPELAASLPYAFELIFSGVVASDPSWKHPQAARQYGLAMIYGAMREQFLTMTSRMPHGARLLPTVSFMDPDPPPAVELSADEKALS